jgi:molybdopterin-guanine dinucleotide biosynthesis protein A
MQNKHITGIILAGGQSSRMGRDKALLPLTGMQSATFVAHLATQLHSTCQEVLLVVRDADQASSYAAQLPATVRIVADRISNIGPLMGLYSGLAAIHTPQAFVIAVDMPLLQPALLEYLLAQCADDTIIVPIIAGTPQVLLAIYPRSILPLIEARLAAGRRDPRSLLQIAPHIHPVDEAQLRLRDPQLRSFALINTPEEFAAIF